MIQMDFSLVEGAFVAKRIITILLALLGALLAAALAYVAYVMITTSDSPTIWRSPWTLLWPPTRLRRSFPLMRSSPW